MAVYPLKHPKTVNGQRYEVLTLQRADGGALRYLDRSGALELILSMKETVASGAAIKLPLGLIDKLAPFFAMVAGVEEAVIDRLDHEDFMGLFDKVDEVLPDSPLSGPTTTT